MGAVDVLADVAGLLIPGVPSAGIKAGVKAADAAYDAYKAVDNLHDVSKFADVTKTASKVISKGDDVADTAKDLKKASKLSNEDLVQKAATLAERKVGGTGRVPGTQKHSYAKNLIDRYQSVYGDRGLRTETSWKNHRQVSYGTKGSARIDVLDTANNCAYDYKFTINPGKGLGQRQVNKIRNNGPLTNGSRIRYVKEINP